MTNLTQAEKLEAFIRLAWNNGWRKYSNNDPEGCGYEDGFIDGYKAAELKWISVKERLPEE